MRRCTNAERFFRIVRQGLRLFQNVKNFSWVLIFFLVSIGQIQSVEAAPASANGTEPHFPKPVEEYHDEQTPGITAKLLHRIQDEPFNLVGTLIFLGAIIHTFIASRFMLIAHRLEHQYHALEEKEKDTSDDKELSRARDRLQFRAQLFHFLGEVEVVFGIWLIPLAIAILLMKGWGTLTSYAASIDAAEPVFVVVVMAMAGSRPVLRFAEVCLAKVASLGRSTVAAWWLAILTVGPLLGSFITEPAAMTICALLLRQKFYDLRPSFPLRYATLALLFVNISVGDVKPFRRASNRHGGNSMGLGPPIYADQLRLEGGTRYSRCQHHLLSAFPPRTREASSKAWEREAGTAPYPKLDHCRTPPLYRLGGSGGTLSAACGSRFFVLPGIC
jgi:hypothetical protein